MKKSRPEVTGGEILVRLLQVDEETRKEVLDNLKPPRPGLYMPGMPTPPPPLPLYTSWRDYIERTTWKKRLAWCQEKAERANQKRLLSDTPKYQLVAEEVWEAMLLTEGRCAYCGSLAVEKKPYDPVLKGRTPWAPVGRRIGTLGHKVSRFHGGDNHPENLCWACMWCNTWISERTRGALDHGGLYPPGDGEIPVDALIAPAQRPELIPEQRQRTRALFKGEEWVKDECDADGNLICHLPADPGETGAYLLPWSRGRDDALTVRGREIWTFSVAMKWLKSLPPEEREAAIVEMESEAELLNDTEPDIFETTGVEPSDGIFCALDVLSRWNSD